eukprot:1136032-Amphidinium_carterae.1
MKGIRQHLANFAALVSSVSSHMFSLCSIYMSLRAEVELWVDAVRISFPDNFYGCSRDNTRDANTGCVCSNENYRPSKSEDA